MVQGIVPGSVEGIVRTARRPPGWAPPGPRPRGGDGRPDLLPRAGEDLCHLTGDWRIFQRLDGHRWSLDDLLTAWAALESVHGRPLRRHADLGSGIGSVLLMVAWARPDVRSIGVEAQEVSVDLARRSIVWNGCEDRVEARLGDLRDPAALPGDAAFDLVTGTPPYLPLGTATVSERVQCGPCRHEVRGGVEDYVRTGARLLAPGGRLAFCQDARQRERVEAAVRDAGLAALRRLDVVPREGRPPLFTLWVLGGEPPPETPEEAPFVVRDREGRRTADCLAMRAAMGLPPPG